MPYSVSAKPFYDQSRLRERRHNIGPHCSRAGRKETPRPVVLADELTQSLFHDHLLQTVCRRVDQRKVVPSYGLAAIGRPLQHSYIE